ncbi:MAG: hypothetical protein ACOY94_10765 [Bacillota bacterium]
MSQILTLGVVDLALGLLVMLPLSLGLRKNEGMSTAFYMLFQVCMLVGISLTMVAGVMVLAL